MDKEQLAAYLAAQSEITNALNQVIWDPRTRRKCADKTAGILNELFGIQRDALPSAGQKGAEELRERGVIFPDFALSEKDIDPIRTHFAKRRPAVDASSPARFYHPLQDVLEAPRLLELAISDQVLEPIAQYFGTMPFLLDLSVWWLQGGAALDGDQGAHRDHVDICFTKLFIYLDDVADDDAPHRFYAGSHNWAHVKKKLIAAGVPQAQLPAALQYAFEANFDTVKQDLLELFKDDAMVIKGKAGTAFLEDTLALHRAGIPAPGRHRLAFQAVYGMNFDPVSYEKMCEMRTLTAWRERVGPSALAKHAVLPWM